MKIFCKMLIFAVLISLTQTIRVDPNNSLFVDQYNRYAVFHGVNAVYKTHPFHPNLVEFSSNYSLTNQDLYNLKHWGMNTIRLHVAWEGVQPQRGVYNYTYVQTIREILKKCDNFGISVLLDAHQDLFTKQFCGQGLPVWVAKRQNFPFPLKVKLRYDDQGYPLIEDCLKIQFAEYYLTEDVMRLQKDIFTNQRGLLDHLCKFWQIIAAYLSNQPNLIGYEFINEPIGSDVFNTPGDTLLPGESNNKYLLPAYKKIWNAIRKVDKKTPVFFQPSILDVFAGGFYDTPGGKTNLETQVFSYHIYCPLVTALGQPKSSEFCKAFDTLQVASKEQNILSMKTGGFLTEFGALSNSPKSAEEVTVLTDLMQLHFRSWTYWQFKYYNDITTAARPGTTQSFYDQYGNLQENKVKALSRPYSYAICGNPLRETLKKGVLALTWIAGDDCYDKKTELFLSQHYYYPDGMNVKFSKNCEKCSVQLVRGQTKDFYEVHLDKKSVGKKVTLTISPK